jgi:HD-GYP domain-containing protein (c-di-GMP phosphodiesterase class II)
VARLKNNRHKGDAEESAKRLRNLRALLSVNFKISGVLDLDDVLETVLEKASSLFQAERGSVMLLDDDRQNLFVKRAIGLDASTVKHTRVKLGQGISGTVARDGSPLFIKDISKDKRFAPHRTAAKYKSNSLLCVPILHKNEVLGVVNLSSRTGGKDFAEDDLEVLQAIAMQTGIAVANARAFEASQRQIFELEFINRVSTRLSKDLKLSAVCDELEKGLSELIPALKARILVVDARKKFLYPISAETGGGATPTFPLSADNFLSRSFLMERGSFFSNFTPTEKALIKKIFHRFRDGKLYIVPLVLKNASLGILVNMVPKEFLMSEGDARLLLTLAGQVATAVENARLFDQAQRQIFELEFINRVSTRLSEGLSLAHVVSELERGLADLIPNLFPKILAADKKGDMLYALSSKGDEMKGDETFSLKSENFIVNAFLNQQSSFFSHFTPTERALIQRIFPSFNGNKLFVVPLTLHGHSKGLIINKVPADFVISDHDVRLLKTLSTQIAISIENATLYEDIQSGYLDTIRALSGALEAKDAYTEGHSSRVSEYSRGIAHELGLEAELMRISEIAGLLHDIGKIGIHENILTKPGKLTDDEYAWIKNHPLYGDKIIAPIQFLRDVRDGIRYHHERFDGRGFPEGRKGEDLPLIARIISVADTFDAMTTDRPYRKALPLSDALDELRMHSGTQFDQSVVEAFTRWLVKNIDRFNPTDDDKRELLRMHA